MIFCKKNCTFFLAAFVSWALVTKAYSYNDVHAIEEIIVTAQKREQPLQKIPISMSVIDSVTLEKTGMTDLSKFSDSIIPSLQVKPNGNSSSTLTISIRGDGPSDTVQPLKGTPVAVYIDGIYLGRSQGLSMELAEPQRIEVLRGPQGTLFGRNSTSGAISLITQKPGDKFAIKQTIGAGNYNQLRSVTSINTGAAANVKARINYIQSKRDGQVKNTARGQADYNQYDKQGSSIAVNWELSNGLAVDYRFDLSAIESTQNYFQLVGGHAGTVGRLEKKRETKTRYPLALTPTTVDLTGHSLIANWQLSQTLAIQSLTGYRELDEDGSLNYGGVLSLNGIILEEDIRQEQFTQEFQLIGDYNKLGYVAGIFYFKENVDYDQHILTSLTPTNAPIIPPLPSPLPPIVVTGDSTSLAVFGHGTIAFTERLDLTLGGRYTIDKKTADRNAIASPDLDYENVDVTLSLFWQWRESVSTYIKWATAYKAGGYNVRSLHFAPYDKETNQTVETGIKSTGFGNKARLNIAAFYSEFNDKQFDFADPVFTIAVDTRNAIKDVTISGAEIDLTAIPAKNLQIGLHYTWLHGDIPEQPHPLATGVPEQFELIQTPLHAGSITLDYLFPETAAGVFNLHINASSTARYAHSTVSLDSQDSYTLFNGQIEWRKIMGINSMTLSVWGKNLLDEKYASTRFRVSAVDTIIQSFGMPRTYGINLTYRL